MQSDSIPTQGLFRFLHPYQEFQPVPLGWTADLSPGSAVVWFVAATPKVFPELEWVRYRPDWMPLFVVLPNPVDIVSVASTLRHLPEARPRAVIPSAGRGLSVALQTLLATPPRSLSRLVVDQLGNAGMIPDDRTRHVVQDVISVAPEVKSIEQLANRMCQSRRTLGRFFQHRCLPVPSHWLQFARILHVAIQLQNTRMNLNRVAARFRYTDGFTMSNSMKRLTGYRPSFVREHLGWEWIVEAWIRSERN